MRGDPGILFLDPINRSIEWNLLGDVVSLAVRFLDDVIEMKPFPLLAIEDATLKTRKIGLGMMGFAEMLIDMEISYNSTDALDIAERVMSFISIETREASRKLGAEPSGRKGRGGHVPTL